MLYCDAAMFCRRRNDAGIMTDETGRRCAQESIDIIIMKNKYYYLFIIKIILITYLRYGKSRICKQKKGRQKNSYYNVITILLPPNKHIFTLCKS